MKDGLVKLFALGLALFIALPAMAEGVVARSMFTSKIENREPADTLQALSGDLETIYYFTELKGFSGQTVTHRWEHDGKVIAEVPMQVKTERYRGWSSKKLMPETRTGEWTVVVVDGSGNELKRDTLSGAAAPAAPEEAPAAAPAQ